MHALHCPNAQPPLRHLFTMPLTSLLTFLSLFTLFTCSLSSPLPQSTFLSLMKQSLIGPAMSRWDLSSPTINPCNLTGIRCDIDFNLISINISSWSLSGTFPPGVCTAYPNLQTLDLSINDLHGGFPHDILNCSSLQYLNLSYTGLTGSVPHLSPLRSIRSLDLSNNLFTGDFPLSITNLTSLEVVNFNENPGFNIWHLPKSFMQLINIKVLILSTTCLRGEIPPWLGNMTSLTDLELSGNFLIGTIPETLGRLPNLRLLELYYNNLTGEIPQELGNLTTLTDIDLSENHLTGRIPENLCALPNLRVLQLYTNHLTGPIPAILGNSTKLSMLSLYKNSLTGSLPENLGRYSDLVVFEVSENQLSGPLPPYVCENGKLLYILVLSNQLTGNIPGSYDTCTSLLRIRVSNNQLNGPIPEGIFGLPHVSIMDMSLNRLEGTMSKSIGNARNLTSLYMSDNQLSGELPAEISRLTALVKIDLSNNQFTGPIPSEMGNLSLLNQLSLQNNRFNSSIPESLSSLKSLNVLNISNNELTGEIPDGLCSLLPNSLDFSHNNLTGPVPLPLIKEGLLESVAGNPNLCVAFRLNLTDPVLPLCPKPNLRRRLNNLWIIGVCVLASILGALFFLKHWFKKPDLLMEQEGLSSTSSFSYDVTSFHKLSFDQHEIVEALIDKNIVGHGGSGTVYKIELSNGELVAVKKLWTRKTKDRVDPASPGSPGLDRELKTEVETLGSIRHKNIVKLYCCYSSNDSNLLVYEYMPNGNLWDALHNGWCFLDWPTRHRIALGIAQGLAYLHHDLLFPIVHRDIKSSNVLLDADFEPKVADFGIAKVLQARREHELSTTTIAGTYGYLAPEYAYSTKATTKCDVYSFGVVLMELVTGKKPIEPEFGDSRDIVHWISTKMCTKEGTIEVLDRRLSWSPYKEEMIQALRVAIRCTCSLPGLRPTMNEVVQLLIEAEPCKSDGNGNGASSFKLKELTNKRV
ncbi:Leucine-rich receptor-like protein kinase family protein [Rhynchospora pubera]|uniref:Leucine-rich receptor-like protein kinase family protein n=1 Tax=Rhynchospora pubera TaxID=906938 RepID=A0AAV8ENL2_9POAL|nr:Leucine-rich receptor-like protein kinase family protein [Rhynchospora pubera]